MKKKVKVNFLSDMFCLTFISVMGGFGFYMLAYLFTEAYWVALFIGLGFCSATTLLLTTFFISYWEGKFKK